MKVVSITKRCTSCAASSTRLPWATSPSDQIHQRASSSKVVHEGGVGIGGRGVGVGVRVFHAPCHDYPPVHSEVADAPRKVPPFCRIAFSHPYHVHGPIAGPHQTVCAHGMRMWAPCAVSMYMPSQQPSHPLGGTQPIPGVRHC